ncbi:MAG: ParA family protein [Candidatus Saccharibacteria bacterium]|jgi:chromosome partitioning protein|nr:ParA family protein [Candidatus Saccharibacteria bacterium]
MAQVITVTNQKGGVGKTTTTVNVAYFLAKAGHPTLVIDYDPQGNASTGLGIEINDLDKTMCEVMLGEASLNDITIQFEKQKNLFVAPTVPELANVEQEIVSQKGKFVLLRNAIAEVEDKYEYILIDSAPSLSLLTVNAMVAADWLLLPVQTEFYALQGVAQLLESMNLVKRGMNKDLKLLGVLATMYDKRTALSSQVLAETKKYFKNKVFDTVIPRSVRIAEAPSHGLPIGAYDRFNKGSKAYKSLAEEILERTNG